ncbi:hypothetical protein [Sphingobacterium multivorum]|uniref:hypothetical protein n=1 Tax=Sphingobacterium multivorum TaxID=28454 RepID=UPI0031BBB199
MGVVVLFEYCLHLAFGEECVKQCKYLIFFAFAELFNVLKPFHCPTVNTLYYYGDGFSNNSFEGSWTNYKTKMAKKCNWGDFSIPESGDLDALSRYLNALVTIKEIAFVNMLRTQFSAEYDQISMKIHR